MRCKNFAVFPLTVNYKGLADEADLIREDTSGRKETMSIYKLIHWLLSVFVIGNVDIGLHREMGISTEASTLSLC